MADQNSEIALILFDCDGTLIDSQRMIVAAMNLAFEQCGENPPTPESTLSIVGLSLPQAIAMLAPNANGILQSRLVETYKRAFQSLVGNPDLEEPLYDGARTTVEKLAGRPNMLLGVATGKSVRGVHRLFDREQFHDHFVTIQTADTNPSKPHPGMVETGMRETGCTVQRTIMVGDTTFDMEMARNADVLALGVTWGYHPADALRNAGAHVIAEDFAEAVHYIERHLNTETLSNA